MATLYVILFQTFMTRHILVARVLTIKESMKDIILGLEKRLLVLGIRADSDALSELISQQFIEYGSSGKIYKYKPGDVFSDFNEKPIDFTS